MKAIHGLIFKWLTSSIIVASSLSCAPVAFNQGIANIGDLPLLISQPNSELVQSYFFPIQNGKLSFEQDDLESNRTSVSFQIQDRFGNFINTLSARDFVVTENNVEVRNFALATNQQAVRQSTDIIFAVDVTGSMSPTIESAKTRLINFIDSTRRQGYRSRMCVMTFGDFTVQHCNRFYNNDPNDPSSLTEINELKTQISNLRALSGHADPGGTDFNENPMRALIDASRAPWLPNNQRFVILVTDDGFLFSPSNRGAVGDRAPFMSEVRNAIDRSQMKVFAVTPSLPGYNSNFSVRENGTLVTYPSIVQMSRGEHFLFSDLLSGRITLDTVLGRILSNILTTYQITYIADERDGLRPHLPINQRRIEVRTLQRPDLRVTSVATGSNLPNGRAEYKADWIISNREFKTSSVKVKIDGVPISSGFELKGPNIRFERAPRANARIEIEYQYYHLKDALRKHQITLPRGLDISSIAIFINAVKAKRGDVEFIKNLEGDWNVEMSDESLIKDVFKIRELNGASIQIFEIK